MFGVYAFKSCLWMEIEKYEQKSGKVENRFLICDHFLSVTGTSHFERRGTLYCSNEDTEGTVMLVGYYCRTFSRMKQRYLSGERCLDERGLMLAGFSLSVSLRINFRIFHIFLTGIITRMLAFWNIPGKIKVSKKLFMEFMLWHIYFSCVYETEVLFLIL